MAAASGTIISLVHLPPQPSALSPARPQNSITSTTNPIATPTSALVTTPSSGPSVAPGNACGGCGSCPSCTSSIAGHTSFSLPTQTTWLSWKNCKTCLKIILNICVALLGLTAAWVALELSFWTSAKDWREYCVSQNETHIIVPKSCQDALDKELSPPPGLSWRWLKNHHSRRSFSAYNLIGARPSKPSTKVTHTIILVLLTLCGVLGTLVIRLFRANALLRQRTTASQTVLWLEEHRVAQNSTTDGIASWVPYSTARIQPRPVHNIKSGSGAGLKKRRTWVQNSLPDTYIDPDWQMANASCLPEEDMESNDRFSFPEHGYQISRLPRLSSSDLSSGSDSASEDAGSILESKKPETSVTKIANELFSALNHATESAVQGEGEYVVVSTEDDNTKSQLEKSIHDHVAPSNSEKLGESSVENVPFEGEDDFPCKACGEILKQGKAFELAGNRWHLDCFRCNTCNTLFDSDSNILLLGDGSLICENCTYSCSNCGNKIEDLAILTGDQAFCAPCFKCRNCKKKIENLRYARTSQGIFCMDCHEALMARRRRKRKHKRRPVSVEVASAGEKAVLERPGSVASLLPDLPLSPAIGTSHGKGEQSDLPLPDKSLPDKSLPDKSLPDKSLPDKSLPDKSLPDKSLPYKMLANIYFEDRRFPLVIKSNIPFHALVERIDTKLESLMSRKYSIASGTVRLRYQDGDGDLVLIDNDEALHEAKLEWHENILANRISSVTEIALFLQWIDKKDTDISGASVSV